MAENSDDSRINYTVYPSELLRGSNLQSDGGRELQFFFAGVPISQTFPRLMHTDCPMWIRRGPFFFARILIRFPVDLTIGRGKKCQTWLSGKSSKFFSVFCKSDDDERVLPDTLSAFVLPRIDWREKRGPFFNIFFSLQARRRGINIQRRGATPSARREVITNFFSLISRVFDLVKYELSKYIFCILFAAPADTPAWAEFHWKDAIKMCNLLLAARPQAQGCHTAEMK